MNIVVIGLSITSSWGNGHATTYRAVLSEMHRLGHRIVFLERDVPWYAGHRDLTVPDFAEVGLYACVSDLQAKYREAIASADAVIVGSYVPDGVAVGEWILNTARGVTAFYDIDTPVTLAKLRVNDFEYVNPELISKFDLYLSFSGGSSLEVLERQFDARKAVPLYCSVDDSLYYPEIATDARWDLGYMGTYSDDRQPALQAMLLDAAALWPEGRFVVAGPQYPGTVRWPSNVERIEHLPPSQHREFYCSQRFTLNITRSDMKQAGYSPSVRLFEAAACGVPIISDNWLGLDTVLQPGAEILLSGSGTETVAILRSTPESERLNIADAARRKILGRDTSKHRAVQLEGYLLNEVYRQNELGAACATQSASPREVTV